MCKVAVIGYGVVGSGTVELFMKNRESISKKVGKECDIKYILDLRDFPDSPFADKMIKDFNIILNDAEVEVVAEVVGGTTFAYDYTKKLLEHGKSVVTSNKALVAERVQSFLKLQGNTTATICSRQALAVVYLSSDRLTSVWQETRYFRYQAFSTAQQTSFLQR